MIGAIIVAAGKSTRFGEDKLKLPLGAFNVIEAAVIPFINHSEIDEIIIAVNAESEADYRKIFDKYQSDKLIKFVAGGVTRTESVRAALKSFEGDYVIVHDGARPMVGSSLITRVINRMRETGACVPVVPLKESIRNEDGALPREWFSTAQTPQGFEAAKLMYAYDKIEDAYGDDAAVYEEAFGIASTVEGDVNNIKITYPSDYYGLTARETAVGIGYDVHRLVKGRRLVLGGVVIPFEKGLLGHSDADVVVHALMDAMLSAVGEGDIGKQFPDTNPEYKDISSLLLLDKVNAIISNKGYVVNNTAATVIIEAPRLSPYVKEMCANIAKTLGIDGGKVAIAATTAEGLGIVGEGAGIASYCIVSLIKAIKLNCQKL